MKIIKTKFYKVKWNQNEPCSHFGYKNMDKTTLVQDLLQSIRNTAGELKKTITLMEVCGGHTNVIMRYGIREILPKNIHLISGPGCPVCVSAQHDIDCIITLAQQGIAVATYGDMLRVPGSSSSLEEVRAQSGNVYEIYSATEVVRLREKHPDIVFFGVGFETTAPMTAYLLENNICVYSVHKLIPPALRMLAEGNLSIDGFLDPGHVSTIIGVRPYRTIDIPQVITGFSPENILRAISILTELIKNKKRIVINGYPEAVQETGNLVAQRTLQKHFSIADSEWRGLGMIPLSGFEVKSATLNAKIRYQDVLRKVKSSKRTKCRCGEVLRGLITPIDCPLYKNICTPQTPQGACMVSAEGGCAIYYRYGK
jgi:hydrogenase expression/formation protein HypD